MDQLPKEIIEKITGSLNLFSKLSFTEICKQTHQTCRENIWLKHINDKYGVNLTNDKATKMLLQMFQENLIRPVPIYLVDEEKEQAEPIGDILLSAADTVGDLVLSIKSLVPGWNIIRIGSTEYLPEYSDLLDIDRNVELVSYGDETNRPDWNISDMSGVILPQKFAPNFDKQDHIDKLSTWLELPLKSIIPNVFPYDLKIVVIKHDYNNWEISIIEEAMDDANETRKFFFRRYN